MNVKDVDELWNTEIIRALAFSALALFVLITARLAKPRRGAHSTDFPPALGTRIILWLLMGVWALLIVPSFDLGIYWLAFIFSAGPMWMLWRWPATISVDEVSIRATAPLRSQVRIHWTEVESVKQSNAGDSLILRARHGENIRVPNTQIGADMLVELIQERTGLECPPL